MKQEFVLQKIWEQRTFLPQNLKTTESSVVEIINSGIPNSTNGPDFTNASIKINQEIFMGDIEIHYQSSDWNQHGHQNDLRYNNVILHVVWKHNVEIQKQNGQTIPTLELHSRVSASLMHHVLNKPNLPICHNQIGSISQNIIAQQLQNALQLRNKEKIYSIIQTHKLLGEDWWRTWLYLHLSHFLGKHNHSAALQLATLADKRYILTASSSEDLIAYFFGIAGWIGGVFQNETPDEYTLILEQKFDFYRFKYHWESPFTILWNYKQVRPASFPQLRIAQFCSWLYHKQAQFDFLTQSYHSPAWKDEINLLMNSVSNYWISHYRLGVKSHQHSGNVGIFAAQSIAINSWYYGLQAYGQSLLNEHYIKMAESILHELNFEINKTTKWMKQVFPKGKNASESQQLIAQFNQFCSPKKCKNCFIGIEILNQNPMKYQHDIAQT